MYSYQTCFDYGLTGVMSRSTGLKRDLRLDRIDTYANYYYLNFRSYVGQNGDCYDRFLIRMNEMTESLNIVNQVVYKISNNKKKNSIKKKSNMNVLKLIEHIYPKSLNHSLYKSDYATMEELINHFKY